MLNFHLALGSNLPSPAGSPAETLEAALADLSALGNLVARSTFHTTKPVGFADQPSFLNAAATLQSSYSPHDLLDHLLAIELRYGRDRANSIPNGPRTLDLDILLCNDFVLHSQALQVPHPRMHQRAFVLLPLQEIAPQQLHPVFNRTVSQLVRALAIRNRADNV